MREGRFCAELFQTARKSLILKMLERSITHAWKSDLFTRADAQQNPQTQFRSTSSRNIDIRRRVLVNHRVDRGFQGVCDTVLTQRRHGYGDECRRVRVSTDTTCGIRYPSSSTTALPSGARSATTRGRRSTSLTIAAASFDAGSAKEAATKSNARSGAYSLQHIPTASCRP